MNHNDEINTLSSSIYKRRVVIGNFIAFLGFIAIFFDPFAGITRSRLLLGSCIGLTGFILRIWASSYQWHNISRPLPEARTGLITSGPYAYVRHPIYLSLIILTFGIFIAFGSWVAALATLIPTVILNCWQAYYEERFLLEKYGTQARDYQKHVWLLLPKFWSPYKTRQGAFSLAQGVKFDIGPLSAFVCFSAIMLLLSFRQQLTLIVTLVVLVVSVVLSFVFTWVVRAFFAEEFMS